MASSTTAWENFWQGGSGSPLETMGPPAPRRMIEPGHAQLRARDLLALRAAEQSLEKVRAISRELRSEYAAFSRGGALVLGEGEEVIRLDAAEAEQYGRILSEKLVRSDEWVASAERELNMIRASFAARWGITLPC